jgi:hypothetical protein
MRSAFFNSDFRIEVASFLWAGSENWNIVHTL